MKDSTICHTAIKQILELLFYQPALRLGIIWPKESFVEMSLHPVFNTTEASAISSVISETQEHVNMRRSIKEGLSMKAEGREKERTLI